jgi:hypothetical protein
MAFAASGLKMMAVGGAVSTGDGSAKNIWHYATNDADTVVETNAYFDGAGPGPGDLIWASLDLDGTAEVKAYVVTGTKADVGLTAMLIA